MTNVKMSTQLAEVNDTTIYIEHLIVGDVLTAGSNYLLEKIDDEWLSSSNWTYNIYFDDEMYYDCEFFESTNTYSNDSNITIYYPNGDILENQEIYTKFKIQNNNNLTNER